MQASGNQRRDRFGEIEGIDLLLRELPILERVQQAHVGPGAGAERLDGQGADTLRAQMGQEQGGQEGLTDAGIGPGDEDEPKGLGRSANNGLICQDSVEAPRQWSIRVG